MSWTVRFTPEAARELNRLDAPVRRRVARGLKRLAADPHNSPNVKALAGAAGRYRLRVGDWRVIYTLQADAVVILVLRIAHRREAYR